jgi:hypothetical protein
MYAGNTRPLDRSEPLVKASIHFDILVLCRSREEVACSYVPVG